MAGAAGKLAKLEEKLQAAYKRGGEKNDYVGGYGGGHLHAESFEAVEQHEKDRQKLAAEVKKARAAAKKEKKNIKQQAAAINEASSWTSKILEGEARFAAAEVDTEGALAQATYGLKSADDFRRTRERLEEEREEERAEARREAERAEVAAAEERRERKRKKRRAEASKLSFEEPLDDESAADVMRGPLDVLLMFETSWCKATVKRPRDGPRCPKG